ncbi:MAG TPA: DUF5916 domain-containing protein, partial [Candidatus Sulfotelmatobacter sp.]|nr:DUF5916 domain-containing protein [Candidatus Sulfotelmatobacter sp.]
SRLQKDIKGGNTVIGGILTGVQREHGLDDQLHRSAYSGGVDFLHQWKNRSWYVRGNVVFSRVAGTREAILRTQTSFEHLFQRPDAPEVALDSNRTSLSGMGGTVRFGRSGGKGGRLGQVLRFETGVTFRSPGLELNDIGFMLSANEINHFTWAGLRFPKAFSIFRWAQLNYNHWSRWDYSGKFIYQAFNFNSHANFKNNWQVGTGTTWNPYDVSNNALRGGRALRRLAGIGHNVYVTTDTRKKVFTNLNAFHFWGEDKSMKLSDYTLSLSVQPLDALRISLSGSYGTNWRRQDQFVTNHVHTDHTVHTVVSQVDQKTLRFTGRLSYNITPDLTVQYYGQPFITRPKYSHFAYVAEPLAKDLEQRFQPYSPNQLAYSNGRYEVDEDGDGTPDFHFNAPDFNFVQFRSNLIARWEYKAGSELYLVWSQGNTPDAFGDLHTPLAQSLWNNAFADQARNSFLVKWTYRFLR